jgi:hypothetical protein
VGVDATTLGETLGRATGEALPVTDVVIDPLLAPRADVPATRPDELGETPLALIVAVPSADCQIRWPVAGGGVASVVGPTVTVPEPCAVEIRIGACAATEDTGNPTPIKSPTARTQPRRTVELNGRHEMFMFPPASAPFAGAHWTVLTNAESAN